LLFVFVWRGERKDDSPPPPTPRVRSFLLLLPLSAFTIRFAFLILNFLPHDDRDLPLAKAVSPPSLAA
jgi:hypothetical protein